MRKVLTFWLTLSAFGAFAQDFKPFKVNLSLGYARPAGSGASGGMLFSVEPKYGLNDQIDLGLRLEAAALLRTVSITAQTDETEIKLLRSYILTGTYLLSPTKFRPYVGVGGGLYSVTGGTFSFSEGSDDIAVEASTKLGGMVRAGFKAGHLNVGAEYNFVPSTRVSLTSGRILPGNNSYLSVKLGFDIGGGYYD